METVIGGPRYRVVEVSGGYWVERLGEAGDWARYDGPGCWHPSGGYGDKGVAIAVAKSLCRGIGYPVGVSVVWEGIAEGNCLVVEGMNDSSYGCTAGPSGAYSNVRFDDRPDSFGGRPAVDGPKLSPRVLSAYRRGIVGDKVYGRGRCKNLDDVLAEVLIIGKGSAPVNGAWWVVMDESSGSVWGVHHPHIEILHVSPVLADVEAIERYMGVISTSKSGH